MASMNEREMGIIITKLDSIQEDIQEIKVMKAELVTRVSSLETFRAWASGVGAVCVAAGGFISKTFLGH